MQNKWIILASVACGTFMATLDASIVNVALPSITLFFKTGLTHSRWVVISYLFSITGLLLFFGKLADVVGRKAIFNLGFLFFATGSLLCGFSQSIDQLILARGLQGFGAAMFMANGPAIITATFDASERGKALGTLAMVVSSGLALGPSLGGFLVKFFSWQSIFFINVPLSLIGAYLVYRFVPTALGMSAFISAEIFEKEQQLPFKVKLQLYIGKLRYFDWLGAILWMFIQFGYSLAIDRENVLGIAGPLQRMISFGSAGLLVLFLIWELGVADPVLDLALFRTKVFFTSNISGLCCFVAISSVTLLMPFYLQNVCLLAPHEVGAVMSAIPLTIFFVAPLAGRLSDRYGSRTLSTLGMLTICSALALFAHSGWGLTSHYNSQTIFHLMLVGLGIGLFQSPNNNAIMSSVEKKHLGVASAMLATVRNLGMVTGTALSSMLVMHFYGQYSSFSGFRPTATETFIQALKYTFLTIAIFCSVGIATSLMQGGHRVKKN